ncbi:hypothetical protein [Paenibacillus campi]|uniref:hypothetical protein n=1 Tax=Paenibacillus campi TaxID=3106031 RepID=UPI002AFE22C8|nr:hypothetical protein [Paenibacillus sp. SGZ-1009]
MRLYPIEICRALKNLALYEYKPLYYVITTDSSLYSMEQLPAQIECVSLQQWSDMIYEDYKQELEQFVASSFNKDVYALVIAASEYRLYQLYANSVGEDEKLLHTDGDATKRFYRREYHLGDFDFRTQLGDALIDKLQLAIAIMQISYDVHDEDIVIAAYTGDFSDIEQVVDGRLIHFADYVIAQDVANRLKPYVDQYVHKAADFVFHASADNWHIDDSVAMREMVPIDLLYRIRPDLERYDAQFAQLQQDLSKLPLLEQLHYWSTDEGTEKLDNYNKTSYQVLESMLEQIHKRAVDPLPLWKQALDKLHDNPDDFYPLSILTYVLHEMKVNETHAAELQHYLNDARWDTEAYQFVIRDIRGMLFATIYPLYAS